MIVLRNTSEKYGLISLSLHWLMAIMIIGMLASGLIMVDLEGSIKWTFYNIHKATGVVILTLAVLRLIWRLSNIVPPLPKNLNLPKRLGAHGAHFLLYVAMFALPISGWLMSNGFGFGISFYGLFDMPILIEKNPAIGSLAKQTHELLGYALIGLISLHVIAGLVHHYIFKDGILLRMFGRVR